MTGSVRCSFADTFNFEDYTRQIIVIRNLLCLFPVAKTPCRTAESYNVILLTEILWTRGWAPPDTEVQSRGKPPEFLYVTYHNVMLWPR